MKHKISKGSVQETLLIPLYGRKMAMELYPDLFSDTDCQRLFDRIDFEAPVMSGIKAKIGAIMAATRQYDMAYVCREYLKEHPSTCRLAVCKNTMAEGALYLAGMPRKDEEAC